MAWAEGYSSELCLPDWPPPAPCFLLLAQQAGAFHGTYLAKTGRGGRRRQLRVVPYWPLPQANDLGQSGPRFFWLPRDGHTH